MRWVLRSSQEASDEFAEAVRWYEERRAGLGGEFLDAVVAMMEMLAANPEIGTPLRAEDPTRRVLVPRFPYQVVYHLTSTEIVVVAIAHLKRRPGYWKSRR